MRVSRALVVVAVLVATVPAGWRVSAQPAAGEEGAEGGEARRLRANTSLMNSWHSFSPNG